LHCLRLGIIQNIDSASLTKEITAVLKALTVGDKTEISPALWRLFQGTGTIHLMAISGLHIGFASGWSYAFVFMGCRWFRKFQWLRLPSQYLASWVALMVATFYTILSGAATPALRAMLMLGCGLAAQLLRLPLSMSERMSVAAIIIIVLDPLAPMMLGFWLSFLAVAMLSFGVFT